ncbi:nitroreductase family deazaflavin-dependent oxidoreductase [Mycobacterium sp. SMC-4]|uniref:nitroreductase family deazaflavin-dependent oxidoreductase n=1 Tax=Mycobacterium sp. SMC-4 TaxID=2857059 RepID=UPI003D0428CA
MFRRLHQLKRWMYRGGRPGALARVLNTLAAWQFSAGVLSRRCDANLLVRGRTSGKTVTVPVVITDYDGERYVVSMLGEDANWVRNVRQAGGRASLRRRGVEDVLLVEVPTDERAPILRRYLALAPGARPHIPVDRRAPLAEFERVAADFPVFRVEPRRDDDG